MCLSILRVCRQIYIEAHKVPWETNMFSFNDPRTFRTFVEGTGSGGGLKAWQKRAWKTLRLDMSTWNGHTDDVWNKALKLSICKGLTVLRRLCLRIEQGSNEAYGAAKANTSDRDNRHRTYAHTCFEYTCGLKRLSIAPWTDVEVLVQPERLTSNILSHGPPLEWSDGDREELADLFKNCLLDKHGAQAYEFDRKALREIRSHGPVPPSMELIEYLGFINDSLEIEFPGYEQDLQEMRTDDELGYRAQVQKLLANGWSKDEASIKIVQDALLVARENRKVDEMLL